MRTISTGSMISFDLFMQRSRSRDGSRLENAAAAARSIDALVWHAQVLRRQRQDGSPADRRGLRNALRYSTITL
jgi:hypothetical protein